MAAHRENVVSLEGNLTRDPELRVTPGGTSVCNFGIAQTELRGETEVPMFYDITVWGDQGEHVAASFTKGHRVVIIGRLQFRQWEDKETGAKRSAVDVVADCIGASVRWAEVTIDKKTSAKSNGAPAELVDAEAPF